MNKTKAIYEYLLAHTVQHRSGGTHLGGQVHSMPPPARPCNEYPGWQEPANEPTDPNYTYTKYTQSTKVYFLVSNAIPSQAFGYHSPFHFVPAPRFSPHGAENDKTSKTGERQPQLFDPLQTAAAAAS